MSQRISLAATIAVLLLTTSVESASQVDTIVYPPQPVIVSGGDYTLILKPDGTAWSIGSNFVSQPDDGSGANSTRPAMVTGLERIRSLSGGQRHAAAVLEDGTVWTWGSNSHGQLGTGTAIDHSSTPVQVKGPDGEEYLTGILTVACGDNFTLALGIDGTVWGWGENSSGQLGDGSFLERRAPVRALGLEKITGISAGRSHSVALTGSGAIIAWGGNEYGQLGNGELHPCNVPPENPVFKNAVALDTGRDHTVVLKDDGTVWSWGMNSYGQLGDVTRTDRRLPVQVFAGASGGSRLEDITAIGCGYWHTLAVKEDGTVWAWGKNDYSQLGEGTSADWTVPLPVLAGESNVEIGNYFHDAVTVTGGGSHSLILKSDGTVWAWGRNEFGQLADGTATNRAAPAQTLFDLNLPVSGETSRANRYFIQPGYSFLPEKGVYFNQAEPNLLNNAYSNIQPVFVEKQLSPLHSRSGGDPPLTLLLLGLLALLLGIVLILTLGNPYYYLAG